MNKIDGLTAGAIAFAAFATWYVVLKPAGKKSTGSAAADQVYGQMTTQRHEVGAALGSNLDYMGGALGLLPGSMSGGSGLGFKGPNTGFWAI